MLALAARVTNAIHSACGARHCDVLRLSVHTGIDGAHVRVVGGRIARATMVAGCRQIRFATVALNEITIGKAGRTVAQISALQVRASRIGAANAIVDDAFVDIETDARRAEALKSKRLETLVTAIVRLGITIVADFRHRDNAIAADGRAIGFPIQFAGCKHGQKKAQSQLDAISSQ